MKALLFVVFSLPILWYSMPSLKDAAKHGFYRFFAFEGLLLLMINNMNKWFNDPFSNNQLLSWFFLIISLCLAVYGFYLLRQMGKPVGSFEDTTRLVAVGIYRYIRHPMYASLLYLGIGAMLKSVTLASIGIFIAICAFLYATARVEEAENKRHFGQAYDEYMKTTKMFIPGIL